MGSFLIYKDQSKNNIDLKSAREIFLKKGFFNEHKFKFGHWHVNLFPKQLTNESDFFCNEKGDCLISNGTWIYRKSSSLDENLRKLLKDLNTSSLNCEQLIGQYVILYWDNDKKYLTFIIDPLFVQRVFFDVTNKLISNSFLALIGGHKGKLSINELAFVEKLTTGFIVGPDTLFNEIMQLVPENIYLFESDGIKVKVCPKKLDNIKFCSSGFDKCVDYVAENLKNYFKYFVDFAENYKPELGISSGFDSRLILALFKSVTNSPLRLQTHLTEGVHTEDYYYAKEIARLINEDIKIIPTKQILDMDESTIQDILDDNLYYFDGRSSFNMGAFSEVYTSSYKKTTLMDDKFSLNGLGGEVLRNYYCFPPSFNIRTNAYKWFLRYEYYPYTPSFIKDKDEFVESYIRMIRKISNRLGIELKNKIDFYTIRRYYSEVRMPDGDGVNNNAHNQLVYYMTPFIDAPTVRLGYMATPFIGVNGEFEAALIRKLAPELARIKSHYGFSFERIPFRHRVCCFLKGYLPIDLFLVKRKFIQKYLNFYEGNYIEFIKLKYRSRLINNVVEFLLENFGGKFNWHFAFYDKSQQQATIMNVGYLFYSFSDKINFRID